MVLTFKAYKDWGLKKETKIISIICLMKYMIIKQILPLHMFTENYYNKIGITSRISNTYHYMRTHWANWHEQQYDFNCFMS